MTLITWKVYVDWDVNNDFTTTGDDITAYVMDMSFSNGMKAAYQLTSDEAELTMRLKNKDRVFSPENSASPYYGKMLPQRPIKITSQRSGFVEVTMYRGWIETFDPSPFRTGDLTCIVRAVGAKQFLQETEVYLPLLQNVTADEILERILGLVVVPPGGSFGSFRLGVIGAAELGVTTYLTSTAWSLETGSTEFAYVGDSWENGISANDAIERVMRAERGHFFYDREGLATFFNRQHYQTHYVTSGTINNAMQGGGYALGADYYPIVRVNCSPRTISSGTADVLWKLETPVRVNGGGTATIRARYMDDSGGEISGLNIGTPTFTMNAGISLFSFEADARSAEAIFVNSLASAGSVTAGTITGKKLTQWNQIVMEASDGSAVFRFGRNVLSINADLIDNTDEGQSIANFEMNKKRYPRGAFSHIDMQYKGSTAIAAQMQAYTMGTRINLQETQTAHNKDYFIVGEEWHVTDALKNTLVRWTLEPAETSDGWLLGRVGFSELDNSTSLGF